MQKRKKNPKLRKLVKQRGCVICFKPSEPCHIKTFGSTRIDEEWNMIPMCRTHHNEQHKIGWEKMVEKYLAINIELQSKGWTWEYLLGKLRMYHENL